MDTFDIFIDIKVQGLNVQIEAEDLESAIIAARKIPRDRLLARISKGKMNDLEIEIGGVFKA